MINNIGIIGGTGQMGQMFNRHFKKIGNKFKLEQESAVRANDPLYLMKNTTCPAPWDKKPGFTEAEPEIIKLNI